MGMTDPIAGLLTRMRNAMVAAHETVDVPAFNLGYRVAEILRDEGYIHDVRRLAIGAQGRLRIFLKYEPDGTPVIRQLRRRSRPGRRVYCKADELPKVLGGLGIAIVSTSKGVMTDRECRRQRLGGEVICTVA